MKTQLRPILPLLLAAAALAAPLACGTSGPINENGIVVLPVRPSLFLRAAPDGDASNLIGQFIPDNVADSDIDESQLMVTSCSKHITANRKQSTGSYQEITAVTSAASGRVGVPGIAHVEVGGKEAKALLVKYELREKLDANVAADALLACCRNEPDQCTKRYVASSVMGDGHYYAATARAVDVGASGTAIAEGVPVQASVVYEHGLKWERTASFPAQYFAFTFKQLSPGAEAKADDCSWTTKVPGSNSGNYFVGVSNVMPTERTAREDAMRDARDQVVKYLGEFLSSASATRTTTGGKAGALSVDVNDVKVQESMAQGVARFVKDQKWCGPEVEITPSGKQQVWKVLAFFSNEEKKAASTAALRAIIEVKKGEGKNVEALEQLLVDVDAGTIKMPDVGY